MSRRPVNPPAARPGEAAALSSHHVTDARLQHDRLDTQEVPKSLQHEYQRVSSIRHRIMQDSGFGSSRRPASPSLPVQSDLSGRSNERDLDESVARITGTSAHTASVPTAKVASPPHAIKRTNVASSEIAQFRALLGVLLARNAIHHSAYEELDRLFSVEQLPVLVDTYRRFQKNSISGSQFFQLLNDMITASNMHSRADNNADETADTTTETENQGRHAPTPAESALNALFDRLEQRNLLNREEIHDARALLAETPAAAEYLTENLEGYDDKPSEQQDFIDESLATLLKSVLESPDNEPADAENAAEVDGEPMLVDALLNLVHILHTNNMFPRVTSQGLTFDSKPETAAKSAAVDADIKENVVALGALHAIKSRDEELYKTLREYARGEAEFTALVQQLMISGLKAAYTALENAAHKDGSETNASSRNENAKPDEAATSLFNEFLASLQRAGVLPQDDVDTLRRLWTEEDASTHAVWRLFMERHPVSEWEAVGGASGIVQAIFTGPKPNDNSLSTDVEELIDTLDRILQRESDAEAAAAPPSSADVARLLAYLHQANILTTEETQACLRVIATTEVFNADEFNKSAASATDVTPELVASKAMQVAARITEGLSVSLSALKVSNNQQDFITRVKHLAKLAISILKFLQGNEGNNNNNYDNANRTAANEHNNTTNDMDSTFLTDDVEYAKDTIGTRISSLITSDRLSEQQGSRLFEMLRKDDPRVTAAFEAWKQGLSDDEDADIANLEKFDACLIALASEEKTNMETHTTTTTTTASTTATTAASTDGDDKTRHTQPTAAVSLTPEDVALLVDDLHDESIISESQALALYECIDAAFTGDLSASEENSLTARERGDNAAMAADSKQSTKFLRRAISAYYTSQASEAAQAELKGKLRQLAVWLMPPADSPGDRD